MNIMQISFTPFINSAGGIEKVFCNLANYFSEENDVINVFCEGKQGQPVYFLDNRVKLIDLLDKELKYTFSMKIKHETIRLLKKAGLSNHTLPKMNYKFSIVKEKLIKIIDTHSPDVIICYQSYITVLLDQIGFPMDKVIVMFHTFPRVQDLNVEEQALLKKVRYIQVLTKGAKEYLSKAGYERIVVIGNALDKSNAEVAKLIPAHREKIIVCVARLDKKQKRQHLLIEAFAKITQKYPGWNLYLYGGNETPKGYSKYLKQIIHSHDLNDRVHLKGISKDVQRDISKCSIFVMPSAYEGFCITLVEAMQLGIPCIGYESCPAVNELIIDGVNGFLVSDGVDSMSQALSCMVSDGELREKISENAIKSIVQYQKDRIYDKWNKYLKVIR